MTPNPSSSFASARRLWDLPTRLFHWALVALMVGMIVTGNLGGEALDWHARLGYALIGTLAFRILWGFVGGHWSRFASFFPTPARLLAHFRGEQRPGHNPLGALSILAVFFLLALQLTTGMMASDDISFNGPLNALVSAEAGEKATQWHKSLGKLLLIVWVVLHLLAILWHKRQGHRLLPAMLHGDATISSEFPESRDTMGRRLLGLGLWAGCVGLSFAILMPLSQ